MTKLKIYNLALGHDMVLEKVDPNNPNHKNAIKEMGDFQGKRMMFDVKQEIKKIKKNRNTGDSLLIRKGEKYIGYLYMSNDNILQDESEVVLSMLINKKMRGMGYGKIVLKNISDYLLKDDNINRVTVFIKNKNVASRKMAEACDFTEAPTQILENTTIYRRSK